MSNSSLASYIGRVSSCNKRNGTVVDKIMVHSMKSSGNCDTMFELMNSSSSSYNYGIANDGTIGLFVDEQYAANGTGRPEVDRRCIHITVANKSGGPDYSISPESRYSLIKLLADICRRNFIKEFQYTGDFQSGQLVFHSMVGDASCPGRYISSQGFSIASEVSRLIDKVSVATSETEAQLSQETIVVDAINAFVATVHPDKLNVDYRSLKLSGVVGVLLYGGSLFNKEHNRMKYVGRNLKAQVDGCKQYMPFALYFICRARDVKEAKQECEELFYVVSKYPPKLGVWIYLDLPSKNVQNNDEILETYYKYLYKWGLHDKCGIQCNKSQLHSITWPAFSSRMSLWIIDHVSDLRYTKMLQRPEFFEV